MALQTLIQNRTLSIQKHLLSEQLIDGVGRATENVYFVIWVKSKEYGIKLTLNLPYKIHDLGMSINMSQPHFFLINKDMITVTQIFSRGLNKRVYTKNSVQNIIFSPLQVHADNLRPLEKPALGHPNQSQVGVLI